MKLCTLVLSAFSTIVIGANAPAFACGGFAEAPINCDDPSPNGFASWMLKRVSASLAVDKAKALDTFTKGANGFRTADSYVFCVASDGIMSAHPNPILQGHDVRSLHDKTGNYFIKTMMDTAKSGEISEIHYLFPKPGSTVEEPKTTYYTKAGDQMCAVGLYDGDATVSPTAMTPEARVAQLRQKLDAQMPTSARSDWTAFLEALNAEKSARDAVMANVRRSVHAVEAAMSPSITNHSPDEND